MDLCLYEKRNGTQIEPSSVHGILWLQTHFESEYWESLSNCVVIIPHKDALMLLEDAEKCRNKCKFHQISKSIRQILIKNYLNFEKLLQAI